MCREPEAGRLWNRWIKRCAAVLLVAGMVGWLGGCATSSSGVSKFTTVVIDAGHGGHDSGTVSRRTGRLLLEKDIALDTALRVERKLRAAGVRTVMTRRDDRFIPLNTRVAISNQHRNSIFLSIHYNHSPKRHISGVEIYHNRRGTDRLAYDLLASISRDSKRKKRFVKTANFRVLRYSRGPAFLVECGFLSNATEAARCSDPDHREVIADAIVKAFLKQRR